MMEKVIEKVQRVGSLTDMHHFYCECSPWITLCGDDSDLPFEEGRDVECVVCADLDIAGCPRCGE